MDCDDKRSQSTHSSSLQEEINEERTEEDGPWSIDAITEPDVMTMDVRDEVTAFGDEDVPGGVEQFFVEEDMLIDFFDESNAR